MTHVPTRTNVVVHRHHESQPSDGTYYHPFLVTKRVQEPTLVQQIPVPQILKHILLIDLFCDLISSLKCSTILDGEYVQSSNRSSLSKSISTLPQKGRLSKCALKGSMHALNLFRVALPHHYLAYWLFNLAYCQEYF